MRKTQVEELFEKAARSKKRGDKALAALIRKNNAKSLREQRYYLKRIEYMYLNNAKYWKKRELLPTRTFKVFYYQKSSGNSVYKTISLKASRYTTKNFVAVRTKFYKANQAKSLEKHCSREISNAYDARKTESVITELMHNNLHFTYRTIDDCDANYQQVTGKKVRSDFRKVYENLVAFSEDQFVELERKFGESAAKKLLMEYLKLYALSVRDEYGFEPLRLDLHLDEGFIDDASGLFRRNIHCHIQFYNYNFEERYAPLARMLKKNVCPTTRKLLPNKAMSALQDLAGEIFAPLGFQRGIKKHTSKKSHLTREKYIAQQQKAKLSALSELDKRYEMTQRKIKALHDEMTNREVESQEEADRLNQAQRLIDEQALAQSDREKWIEKFTRFLFELRNWKMAVVDENFQDIRTYHERLITLFLELDEQQSLKGREQISQLEMLLADELELVERFERQYHVLSQQKVSRLFKKFKPR